MHGRWKGKGGSEKRRKKGILPEIKESSRGKDMLFCMNELSETFSPCLIHVFFPVFSFQSLPSSWKRPDIFRCFRFQSKGGRGRQDGGTEWQKRRIASAIRLFFDLSCFFLALPDFFGMRKKREGQGGACAGVRMKVDTSDWNPER